MNISFGDVTLITTAVIDGPDMGSHAAERHVRVQVTKRQKDSDPIVIEFDVSPEQAVNIGTKLCSDAWSADKDAMRSRGEVYRRLGFYQ